MTFNESERLTPNGTPNGDAPSPTLGFSTRAIHIGSAPDASTGAVIPPITLSTTFSQSSIGTHKGFEYTRSSNPNRAALEETLASLESGGAHALAFASGSAATSAVVQSLGTGAHVVCVNDVYGGTFRYLTRVGRDTQGLQTTFVDLEGEVEDKVRAALRVNTKLIWIETPTNPTLRLISIPRLSSFLRTLPSPPLLLVDNTFLSPFYASPLLHGASLVLHSLTKYLNGHSDVLMGALILPASQAPLHTRLQYLQNAAGAVPSPFDCFLAQRGLKTLQLRMKSHGLNALRLASALHTHPRVKDVVYPGLATHPRHDVALASLSPHAQAWIESGDFPADARALGVPYGGMVALRLAGGARAAERFVKATRLFVLAESLGGVESLVEVPARMTHVGVPQEERQALGIGEDLVRLSVGVEDGEDLIRDVLRALENVE